MLARQQRNFGTAQNPLFNRCSGTDPATIITVGALHAIYLGVMKDLCREIIWLCINSGLCGVGAIEDTMAATCLVLKHELLQFYKRFHDTVFDPPNLTQISDITPKMLDSITENT